MSSTCFAQKAFLFDKTDPFTKERTILYGNLYVSQFAQACVSIRIKDSSKQYQISFIIPYMPSKTEGGDSVIKECKIMLPDGHVLQGKWLSTSDAVVLGQKLTSFNYEFTKDEFDLLLTTDATAIKMNQYTYEVAKKYQDRFKILIKKVYDKL
jgi:hypothetical protein